jgi:diguanylate cyclase (GGDEF)-like protein
MRKRLDVRELAHATVPVVVALLVLASAPLWEPRSVAPEPSSLFPLFVLTLVAALAGLYSPSQGRGLGLGALALPPALWFFGLAWAGWLAAAAYVLREMARRLLFRVPLRQMEGVKALPTAADAARVCLATVLAGYLWLAGVGSESPISSTRSHLPWGLAAVLAYIAVLLVLHWIEMREFGVADERITKGIARAAAMDGFGWVAGVLLVGVLTAAGWTEVLLLISGAAVLAAEASRNVYLRQRAVTRATELWEVTKAGHRIIFRGPDLGNMAAHVLEECRNVLPFDWFQFELLQGEERGNSWCAGPDGQLAEGLPAPADSPPALPGVHRRTSWKILQRQLKGDGEPIAYLRFWCDPRKLETASTELLDSLLPQIAAAIHRALLDRQAKQDPLTGLADRRVLEARLEEVFVQTYAMGGSMAVIMCDLDRFKKINDTHGHDVGDQALLQVVRLLEEHRRDSDLCSRYGGEEFALVLEKTDGETALRVAERLRHAVEHCLFVPDGTPVPLRLSAGVAAYPELHVKEGKDLLVLADEALIVAKKKGRNRSLLNQGPGRYRTPRGKTLEEEEAAAEPEAPTLFA